MIWFDSTYNSGENEVLFVNNGAKVSGPMAVYYFWTQGGK